MDGKRWQWVFLLLVGVLIVAFGLNLLDKSASTEGECPYYDVRAYFPSLAGMTYYYVGEGMEYAHFSRRLTHVAPGAIQVEDLSGTNLVQVIETSPQELRSVWSEEEFLENRSLLEPQARSGRESGWNTELVLLQAPLEKGHTWSDERFQREIVATELTVRVPLGEFQDVVVVKNKSINNEGFVQYEYYAKNIGLIKREALFVENGDTYAVVSSLRSIAGTLPR